MLASAKVGIIRSLRAQVQQHSEVCSSPACLLLAAVLVVAITSGAEASLEADRNSSIPVVVKVNSKAEIARRVGTVRLAPTRMRTLGSSHLAISAPGKMARTLTRVIVVMRSGYAVDE